MPACLPALSITTTTTSSNDRQQVSARTLLDQPALQACKRRARGWQKSLGERNYQMKKLPGLETMGTYSVLSYSLEDTADNLGRGIRRFAQLQYQ
ncbi:uncharacterized protein RAG0_00389 [Rhynchosporium agropyri]|uniref:Uncharacterized protein n=1 Tax=Rhynchosporium agropyri TaxID=914238 RepID=A0A1E1JS93_9HELO|nr:uncharacterized protein RAG0_00389 [Rhynchosporium agropyri]